mgnify:CR=1 FL=1
MQASINTAVYLNEVQGGQSQFECLKQLVGQPIDNIEVRGELFDRASRDKELFMIQTLCTSQNWGFYFSIPTQLFDQGQLNPEFAEYVDLAKQYHMAGLKISLGDAAGFDLHTAATLHRLLVDYQGQVTVENQPNAFSKLPAFAETVKALLEAVPELGYTFDSGNWYWIDEPSAKAFASLKSVTTIFHLKDILNQDTVMLGEGQTDWAAMVNALDEHVPVFLEYAITPDQVLTELAKVNAVLAKR